MEYGAPRPGTAEQADRGGSYGRNKTKCNCHECQRKAPLTKDDIIRAHKTLPKQDLTGYYFCAYCGWNKVKECLYSFNHVYWEEVPQKKIMEAIR